MSEDNPFVGDGTPKKQQKQYKNEKVSRGNLDVQRSSTLSKTGLDMITNQDIVWYHYLP